MAFVWCSICVYGLCMVFYLCVWPLYGVLFVCMALYGVLFVCMALYGVLFVCMALYGVLFVCMAFVWCSVCMQLRFVSPLISLVTIRKLV